MVFDRRPHSGLTSIPRIPRLACRPSPDCSVETELLCPLAPALLNGVRRYGGRARPDVFLWGPRRTAALGQWNCAGTIRFHYVDQTGTGESNLAPVG